MCGLQKETLTPPHRLSLCPPSPPPMVSQEQRLVEQWGMLLQADTIPGVPGQGCQLSIHPTHPPLEGSL